MSHIGLYSDTDTVGGAERSLLHLAAAYDGPAELLICSPSRELLETAAQEAPDVRTHLLTSRRVGPGAILDHLRELRRLRLDLLQVTLCNPFTARPAMLAGMCLGIPTVAVEQLVLGSRRRSGAVLKHLLSLPLAAHVVVGHASAQELSVRFRLRPGRLHVVHNGVPPWRGDPVRFAGRPVIGCAARLEHQKGIDVLIEAMVGVPEARLVLVGDGTCRQALSSRATALGIADRVEFIGWKVKARPYIAGFDVFVLPSRDEAFPLTIPEAMLSSVPVVATDVGSVSEAVVDGETGLLVGSGQVDALADAIRRLLADVELRTRLTTTARALAERRFTATTMAEGYASIWREVLGAA